MSVMDETTLEALKGSIEKWEGIVAGDTRDIGGENCPLCIMFQDEDEDDDIRNPVRRVCDGCPVKAKTGLSMCGGTPYRNWICVEPNWGDGGYIHTARSLSAAQAELDFLKSLLPSP